MHPSPLSHEIGIPALGGRAPALTTRLHGRNSSQLSDPFGSGRWDELPPLSGALPGGIPAVLPQAPMSTSTTVFIVEIEAILMCSACDVPATRANDFGLTQRSQGSLPPYPGTHRHCKPSRQ